ncbi:uncharacterized protein N7506_007377 [Penicillium brevicompactum]|uniref:uncharacterized protein n=1 Tax=Penicillium brevicompactum TaxID=5074 RepID=UPI0025406F3F|nr:uncharacterized protein N7506_007377 [Penicillium brevicompactum]KAJ5333594.1 hypothetical protein N7506_007377 [Penicillium brevicompactum]
MDYRGRDRRGCHRGSIRDDDRREEPVALAIATLGILQGLDGLIGQSAILCYQGPWAALAGGAGPSLR